jgi:hypothetical protein
MRYPERSTGGYMRTTIAAAILLACAGEAGASASLACQADDPSVTFALEGAWGRSAGSGVGNFGGEVEIKLKAVPDYTRKLKLETSHLTQNWYHGRDIKLAVLWMREGNEPSAEVLLIVEAQRGKGEENAYRGRYKLTVSMPDSDKPRTASGRVTCSAD